MNSVEPDRTELWTTRYLLRFSVFVCPDQIHGSCARQRIEWLTVLVASVTPSFFS